LHPFALKGYFKSLLEVHETVPNLDFLNDEDLGSFLSDTECAGLKACEDEIKGWLEKCNKTNSQATLNYYPCRNPFDAMWDMKKLIKKVAERRVEKERQLAALEAINLSFDTSYERLHLSDILCSFSYNLCQKGGKWLVACF